jgi:hypothetical protein
MQTAIEEPTYLLLEWVPQIQDSVDMHPFPRNAGLALAWVWFLFMTVTSTTARTATMTIHRHSLSIVEFSKLFVAVVVRFGDADVFIDFTFTVSPGRRAMCRRWGHAGRSTIKSFHFAARDAIKGIEGRLAPK